MNVTSLSQIGTRSTNYADTSRIREYVRELLIDWLAKASIRLAPWYSFNHASRNMPCCIYYSP